MDAAALNGRGNQLFAEGQTDAAIACYRAALAVAPHSALLHFNLANALEAAGEANAALASFDTAIALDPTHAGAHNNRGNLLRKLDRPAEALDAYRRALRANPADPATRYNLGTALLDLHRPEEALVFFQQAATAPAPHPPAFASAGELICRLGRPAEALGWFREALRHLPGNADARFGAGVCLLALGDFANGWAGFEARLETLYGERYLPRFDQPPWDGQQSLAGKRLLLVAEQGFGDTIQFARFAPALRRRGAHVILWVPDTLCRLLAPLADATASRNIKPPAFDLHCPMMSLPHVLRITEATIPAAPYLHPPEERKAAWRARLGPASTPRIGLACSGNPDHMLDAQRSIPLAAFAPLLALPGFEFHLLQKGLRDGDAPPPHLHVPTLTDFCDTAALAGVMDLVITVDTSLAHVAGGLGRPTWTLLQHNADFRWMRERMDTPWYPTMRLFRQSAMGDWRGVIATVADALRRRFVSRPRFASYDAATARDPRP